MKNKELAEEFKKNLELNPDSTIRDFYEYCIARALEDPESEFAEEEEEDE